MTGPGDDSIREIRERPPPPAARFDVLGALAATAAAAVAYLVALSAGRLPTVGFSVVLLAAAPVCGALALPIVLDRGRRGSDPAVEWFAAGLAGCVLAMALLLISISAVADDGGPLGTNGQSGAALYLIFHLWLYAGAVAGATRAPPRLRWPFLAVGLVATAAAALNLLPLPELIGPGLTFTTTLNWAQGALTALGAWSVWVWLRGEVRATSPLRGWIGVCLSISSYELLLNTLAARRYDAVWWSSLSLRVAGFAVLAGGCVWALLRQLASVERYSEAELLLRDAELARSVAVTDRLLDFARQIGLSLTPGEVVSALSSAAHSISDDTSVSVLLPDALGDLDGSRNMITVGLGGELRAERRTVDELREEHPLPAGEPAFLDDRDDARLVTRLVGLAGTPDEPTIVRAAPLPLRAAGAATGLLLVSGRRAQRWSRSERELLTGLADQAGPALSRALLFEREHRAAETLQRSLLPRRLPRIEGVTFAARYKPANLGEQVGGDWYYAWQLADGRLAMMVGDVVGKGLQAAATMGRLQASVTALAGADPAPATVLTRLDRMLAADAPAMIATVLYVLLDPVSRTARVSRAGHLPLLVAAEGEPAYFANGGGGPPIGTAERPAEEISIDVPDGTTLVLYTDGLVEDRNRALDQSLERLRSAATDCTRDGADCEQIASHLLRLADDHSGSDDVALLVARIGDTAG